MELLDDEGLLLAHGEMPVPDLRLVAGLRERLLHHREGAVPADRICAQHARALPGQEHRAVAGHAGIGPELRVLHAIALLAGAQHHRAALLDRPAHGVDRRLQVLDRKRGVRLRVGAHVEHHRGAEELLHVDLVNLARGLPLDDVAAVIGRVDMGRAMGVHVVQDLLTPPLTVGQVLSAAAEELRHPVAPELLGPEILDIGAKDVRQPLHGGAHAFTVPGIDGAGEIDETWHVRFLLMGHSA
ncbi:MAG: hypothetical protein VW582_02980 [Rhodospirillaceae bacterium]